MFPCKTLLSFILISLTAVDADPLIRSTGQTAVTVVTKINQGGARISVEKDQTRAKLLQTSGQQQHGSLSFNDTSNSWARSALVGIGNPPQNYTLIIDTATPYTWIGAQTVDRYYPSNTSKDTGKSVDLSYYSPHLYGEEWTDTMTFSGDIVIEKQSIAVVNASSGLSGPDGILALGRVDVTNGTVENESTVPTILDNLVSQGAISQAVMGYYCEPNSDGIITFGGYDSSVITDSVKYVPLTTASPASKYWGIEQSIHYGDTVILSTTAGIVDTGSTFILLATDAYKRYQSATGSTFDPVTKLLSITTDKYTALKTLSFNIGDTSYDLTPNAQIWPRTFNADIGGTSQLIYLIIGDLGTNSGSGYDFVLGFAFLERYYSVFDATNKQMGFASTAYSKAEIN